MTEIRRTTDAGLLAELSEEVHLLHHSWYPEIFKPYNGKEIEQYIQALFEKGATFALIAVEDGKTKGYCLLNSVEHKESAFSYARRVLMVDQFHILSTYRRQGIGKQLMRAIDVVAKELKVQRLELNHWTANEPACKFFNAVGFSYHNEKMYKLIT